MHNSISTDEHIDLLLKVIAEKEHLLEQTKINGVIKKTYDFKSKLVISDNIVFLDAIRKEIGGELIVIKTVGSFLYFD